MDYVIGDGEMWDKVGRIEVEDNIESDYFPIVITIKDGKEEVGQKVENIKKIEVNRKEKEDV